MCFFQRFVAQEGRQAGSLKRAGAEPCGQRRNEQLHAPVAQSTLPSQNEQNTAPSDHFLKLTCTKQTMFGPLLEVTTSKNCTPL